MIWELLERQSLLKFMAQVILISNAGLISQCGMGLIVNCQLSFTHLNVYITQKSINKQVAIEEINFLCST